MRRAREEGGGIGGSVGGVVCAGGGDEIGGSIGGVVCAGGGDEISGSVGGVVCAGRGDEIGGSVGGVVCAGGGLGGLVAALGTWCVRGRTMVVSQNRDEEESICRGYNQGCWGMGVKMKGDNRTEAQ
jgi:hypothetical protein